MKKNYLLIIFFLCTAIANAQTPWLLKDINATGTMNGPVGAAQSLASQRFEGDMFSANGLLFFIANDGIHGDELWRTDGTANGTYMLADITPGSSSTSFRGFYETSNLLYFYVDGSLGGDVWRTDGTSSGTYLIMASDNVHSIEVIADLNGSANNETTIGNSLYFFVNDNVTTANPTPHDKIYSTDGTVAGTSLYYDAGTEPVDLGEVDKSGRWLQHMIAVGSTLYVFGQDELLNTNGTADTTTYFLLSGTSEIYSIKSPQNGFSVGYLINVNNNYLLITGNLNSGTNNLYRLKPSETTPVLLEQLSGGGGTNILSSSYLLRNNDYTTGNFCFFRNGNNVSKWVTNGEPSGTFALSGMTNNSSSYTGIVNNKMTFVGDNDSVYFWDGLSPTSYQLVSSALTNQNIVRAVQVGNKAFYINEQNKPIQTSDLSGNNCFAVYASRFLGSGEVINSNYIDYQSTDIDGCFNGGYEPCILNANFKIFTGAVSNDWQTADNWDPSGVPTATDDVVIPMLPAISTPVITAAATCHNFTICNATLTVTSANLDINGYVANYLSTISGSGSVTLKSVNGTKFYGSNNGFFNVANVYINDTSVSFGIATAAFNSPVSFLSDSKIEATYSNLIFNTPPFITGGNANRFVVIPNQHTIEYVSNGATLTDSSYTFPVGTSVSLYTPLSFSHNKKNAAYGSLTLSLVDSVNADGSTGNLLTSNIVNKQWLLNGSFSDSLKLSFSWNAANELTGFNRNASFVGDYENPWQMGNVQAAGTANGQYTITQAYNSLPAYSNQFAILSSAATLPLSSYTFNGSGNWSNAANWLYNAIPPDSLASGTQITINPITNGECVLDVIQNILKGGTITIAADKKFIVPGDLKMQ